MDIVKPDCSRLQEVWSPCPQELLSSGGQPTNNVAGQLREVTGAQEEGEARGGHLRPP